jgi:hypothetical protein
MYNILVIASDPLLSASNLRKRRHRGLARRLVAPYPADVAAGPHLGAV